MEKKELIKLKTGQINKEYSKQRNVYSIGFCKEPRPHYEIRFFDLYGKYLTNAGVAIWPYKDKDGNKKVHNQPIMPDELALVKYGKWKDCGDYKSRVATYGELNYKLKDTRKRIKAEFYNLFTGEFEPVATINKKRVDTKYMVTDNQIEYLNRKIIVTAKEFYTIKQEQWAKIKNVVGLIDELLLI